MDGNAEPVIFSFSHFILLLSDNAGFSGRRSVIFRRSAASHSYVRLLVSGLVMNDMNSFPISDV